MSITATELKNNLGKYLLLAATEEVFITRNGKTIAKLTSPYQNKLDTVESLFGSVPASMTLEEAREERLIVTCTFGLPPRISAEMASRSSSE